MGDRAARLAPVFGSLLLGVDDNDPRLQYVGRRRRFTDASCGSVETVACAEIAKALCEGPTDDPGPPWFKPRLILRCTLTVDESREVRRPVYEGLIRMPSESAPTRSTVQSLLKQLDEIGRRRQRDSGCRRRAPRGLESWKPFCPCGFLTTGESSSALLPCPHDDSSRAGRSSPGVSVIRMASPPPLLSHRRALQGPSRLRI